MELNIKFDEKMIIETANRVLDEFEYKGKTIREWADMLANQKTNADRIRSMTDEELEDFLDRWGLGDIDYSKTFCSLCDGQFDCHECRLDWLRKEYKSES